MFPNSGALDRGRHRQSTPTKAVVETHVHQRGRVQYEAYRKLLGMRTYVSEFSIQILLYNHGQDLMGIIVI